MRNEKLGEISAREQEALDLRNSGMSYRDIAEKMEVSYNTVCMHLSSVRYKLSKKPNAPKEAPKAEPVKIPEKIVNGLLPQSQAPKQFLTIDLQALPEGAYLVSTDQGPVIRFFQGGRWYFPTNSLTIDLTREASSNPLICILRKVS